MLAGMGCSPEGSRPPPQPPTTCYRGVFLFCSILCDVLCFVTVCWCCAELCCVVLLERHVLCCRRVGDVLCGAVVCLGVLHGAVGGLEVFCAALLCCVSVLLCSGVF